MEKVKVGMRSHFCGILRAEHTGEKVSLCGWVQRRRDLGGLVFVTLRDRTGIIQCVFSEEQNKALFDAALALRAEFTIKVEGVVALRADGARNPQMPTGDVEVWADTLTVFSKADTPPFEIVENSDVNDTLRLTYRYLDLRRPDMQRIVALRHRVAQETRRFFDANDFLEIETPLLTKSTPEGARDYLVPSRVQPGKFFALPQSPQQYKQLLMLAGCDRYFQITRCLRDEDLRADRQPEFTQIDVEMSFVNQEDVLHLVEEFIRTLFANVLDVTVPPIPRMTYAEAMDRFGSDKPDLRFGYELKNISDQVRGCGFKVFDGALEKGGSVRCIVIDGGADKFSRREIDSLTEFVKTYRAGGLAWAKCQNGQVQSSFGKFISEETMQALLAQAGAKDGDLVLIVADGNNDVVFSSLGALRCECAKRTGVIDKNDYKFLWVVDFPLYEMDEEEGRLVARHHPFTAPKAEDIPLLDTAPEKVRAQAYDMVLNGYELGGGSVRIHQSDLQEKMFSVMGFTKEQIQSQFGHLIEAFRYGAPPHGGLAFGLDRIVMLMAGRDNLRDVIAFPKVQNSSELMMASPSEVDPKQLAELGIALSAPEEAK